MKIFKKDNLFLSGLFLIFLFFLQRQFFSLLKIDIVSKISPSLSIVYLVILFSVILIAILWTIYYVPALFVMEILSLPMFKVIWIKTIYQDVVTFVNEHRILIVSRNKLYCQFRC